MRPSTAMAVLFLAGVTNAHSTLGRRSRQARHAALTANQDPVSHEKRDLLDELLGVTNDAKPTAALPSTAADPPVRPTSAVTSSAVTRSSPVASSVAVATSSSTSLAPSSSIVSVTSSAVSSLSTGVSSIHANASTSQASSEAPSSVTSTSHIASSTSAEASKAVTTITTDAGGQASVITLILTSTEPAQSAAAETSAAAERKSDGGGISKGAIIGISVAAGVVLLALIGCAIWRMKRRNGDEDDAIRWPELNRHGDSDTHHALPARQTGQHGFETGLERSISNSSDMYGDGMNPPHSAHSHGTGVALNGSGFGAPSSLEDYPYDDKMMPPLPGMHGQTMQHPATPGYDHDDDYSNMPPQLQVRRDSPGQIYPDHDSEEGVQMMAMSRQGQPATYHHGY